jgi:hypothetical protein
VSAEEYLRDKLPNVVEQVHAGQKYRLANAWAYYAPATERELVVVAPQESIAEIIDSQGDPPLLRRDVERLLTHTDADRHVTIVCAPNFLGSEGQRLFQGQLASLHSPLSRFFGDELSAAAFSLHWDDNFFVELLAVPTLDTSPERTSHILAERLAKIPEPLEDYVVALDVHPHGRRVIARLPAMVRKLAAYTRGGFETDHATLRCYLPAIAGHNLLMGVELVLAESLSSDRSPVLPSADSVGGRLNSPKSEVAAPRTTDQAMVVQERLRQITSLSFSRETLEAALDELSRSTGVAIVIAGTDLQAEGITKNQSFSIDLANRPAEEILVEILRLANPDKSATGPDDSRQKLVYVTRDAGPNEPGQIVVTTRSAAAARGDELPLVFREKSP